MIFFNLTVLGILATCSSANEQIRKRERNLQEVDHAQAFNYPINMPSPPDMLLGGIIPKLIPDILKHETPIQIWMTNRIDQVNWNCVASYHPTALNAVTKSAPAIRAPREYHTSESRALCMIHAVNKLVPELIPISSQIIHDWLLELNLDSSILSDSDAERLALVEGDFTPRVIGSLLASEIISDMQHDGWNYKGLDAPNGKKCTANCRPFSDTTGYIPKNNPWELLNGQKVYYWQPLIESNELGFFYSQEHVTPHIGLTANPAVLTRTEINARVLNDPRYDYDFEVDKVIENVANLDNFQKTMVSFFDNKLNLVGGLMMMLRAKYK